MHCYTYVSSIFLSPTPGIVIKGLSPSSVAEAKRRVEIIVWTNRTKERPTHFISIPLTQPHIKERVAEFKRAVLDSYGRVCYRAEPCPFGGTSSAKNYFYASMYSVSFRNMSGGGGKMDQTTKNNGGQVSNSCTCIW